MARFDNDVIEQVWAKANVVMGYDPNVWRKDFAGAWIRKDHYGKEWNYGWEIDHLTPVSRGGSDQLVNLIPMHWKNNRQKSDNYPEFESIMTSQDNSNIEKQISWRVR
jgi:hypothetical protein